MFKSMIASAVVVGFFSLASAQAASTTSPGNGAGAPATPPAATGTAGNGAGAPPADEATTAIGIFSPAMLRQAVKQCLGRMPNATRQRTISAQLSNNRLARSNGNKLSQNMALSAVHPDHQLISSEEVNGTNGAGDTQVGTINHLMIDENLRPSDLRRYELWRISWFGRQSLSYSVERLKV